MENSSESQINNLKRANSEAFAAPLDKEKILIKLQDFSKEIERIDNTYLAGAFESWFEPAGKDNRTFDEEMDYALKNRENGYIPEFTYPALERGYLDENDKTSTSLNLQGALSEITKLKKKNKTGNFKEIEDLATNTLSFKEKSYLFLEAIKDNDLEGVIQNMPHSFPDKNLVEFAKEAFERDLKPKEKKKGLAKKLRKQSLTQSEAIEYTKYALSLMGAPDWQVLPTSEKKSFTTLSTTKTVLVPESDKSTLNFLITLAHESVHVATAINAEKLSLGSISLGEEATTINEGLAKLAESDIETKLMGKPEREPNPYYVLGIKKAMDTNGDFWETFDYLVKLRAMELKALGNDDEKIEKKKYKTPLITARRIFRGSLDLSKGGYVYTKDKTYLEGEYVASKIKEKGLLGYFLAGKFDIATVTFLVKTAVLPKETINLTSKVVEKILENKGDIDFLTNTDWYRENYNPPYWRELGVTDEEYAKAWIRNEKISPKAP